jgi:hypothetical protein
MCYAGIRITGNTYEQDQKIAKINESEKHVSVYSTASTFADEL